MTFVGQNPWVAAHLGHVETIKQLHENGAPLDVQNNGGDTPLHLAAANGQVHALFELGAAGVDPDTLNFNGRTPLHLATAHGHVNVIEALHEMSVKFGRRANFNASTLPFGDTAAHIAARTAPHNVAEVYSALNAGGAALDQPNRQGYTPLLTAAFFGNANAIAALHTVGKVNLNSSSARGFRASHWAARRGHANVISKLNEIGAEEALTAFNDEGDAPLHIAAASGHIDVLAALSNAGIDLTTCNAHGRNAAGVAASNGQRGVLEFLLQRNGSVAASVTARDQSGQSGSPGPTPAQYARTNQHVLLADWLEQLVSAA